MPFYARMSPQPAPPGDTGPAVFLDEDNNILSTKKSELHLSQSVGEPKWLSKSLRSMSIRRRKSSVAKPVLFEKPHELSPEVRCTQVFPRSMDDPTVIASLTQEIVPSISKRSNVTLVLHGHSGAGKTCMMEQLLPSVMEALRPAVVAADEAHQEMISIEGPAAAKSLKKSRKKSVSALKSTPSLRQTQSLSPSPTGQSFKKLSSTIQAAREKRAATPMDRATSASPSHASTMGRDKYALMFANLPRKANVLQLSEVQALRPASAMRLIPDLTLRQKAKALRLATNGSSPTPAAPMDADNIASTHVAKRLDHPFFLRSRSPTEFGAGHISHLGLRNGRGTAPIDHLKIGVTKEPLELPHMPEMDLLLKSEGIKLSFWINIEDSPEAKKKLAVFHFYDSLDANYSFRMLLNTNSTDEYEQDIIMLTLRDSHSKSLEMSYVFGLADSNWHFVLLTVIPKENQLVLAIDGKPLRPKVMSCETPQAFHENRPKVGLLGCTTQIDEEGNSQWAHHLQALMYDFTVTSISGVLASHYPMKKEEADILREMTGNAEDVTGQELHFEPKEFPATAPYFDGKGAHVNIGQLGDYGLKASSFGCELTLRTSCTTEHMCLVGVVDTPGKHPGFGIDLNCNANMGLQRCHICGWLTDYAGNYIRCIAEVPDLFDDRWHHVSLKLIDLSLSKFKLKIDGRTVDVSVHHSSNLPAEFLSYQQPVTVGCVNSHGTLTRFFRGSIHHVKLTRNINDLDEIVATYSMDEGPGARLAMDSTGHGYSGVYHLAEKKKGSVWFPLEAATAATADEVPAALEENMKNVVHHNNNIVSMAYIAVTGAPRDTGNVRGQLQDLLNGTQYDDLEDISVRETNDRLAKCDRRHFQGIPEACFREVTPSDYMQVFRAGLHRTEEYTKAHLIFVFRLGDAFFYAMDLCSLSKTNRAHYSYIEQAWSDTIFTLGVTNKINLFLNAELKKLEKVMTVCGGHPQLYKRSFFCRDVTPATTDGILPNIMLHALAGGSEKSDLWGLFMVAPQTTHDEAVSLVSQVEAMQQTDRLNATIVLQKQARYRKARKKFMGRRDIHDAADNRRDLRNQMKQLYPKEMKEKAEKHALIINCFSFAKDNKVPSLHFHFDDVRVIHKYCDALGFHCTVLNNPAKQVILDTIREIQEEDKMLLVYFVGYISTGRYYIPPSYAQSRAWVEEVEERARNDVSALERKDLKNFRTIEFRERGVLEEQLRREAEEAAKKKGKKKKAAAAPKKADKKGAKNAKEEKQVEVVHNVVVEEEPSIVYTKYAALLTDHKPPEEPVYDEEEHTYLLVGDTASEISAKNTILLDDLRGMIVGEAPQRGVHSIFIYDCFPLDPVGQCGCGGIVASSSEAISMEYNVGQSFLLGYYIKKCLQGCAVEAVRIGKHEPPGEVTMEIATRYITQKIGPKGQIPVKKMDVLWFGEYVGDAYLAPKLLSKKEDRKKAKLQTRKGLVKLHCATSSALESEFRAQCQGKIAQIMKVQLVDIRRVQMDDFVTIFLEGSFTKAVHHPSVEADAMQVMKVMFPGAGIQWHFETGPLRIVVSQSNKDAFEDDPRMDMKQRGKLYVEAYEKHFDGIQKNLVVPFNALQTLKEAEEGLQIAGFPVLRIELQFTFLLFASEVEGLRLERASREGVFLDPSREVIRLIGAHSLSEKESQENEQLEKFFNAEDLRRQAEAKARLIAEVEARKKAEEARLRLEKLKGPLLQKLDDSRSAATLSTDTIEEFFSVPLPDVYVAAMDTCASFVNRVGPQPMLDGKIVAHIKTVFSSDCVSEQKLHNAGWKLVVAMTDKAMATAATLAAVILPVTIQQFPQVPVLWHQVSSALSAIQPPHFFPSGITQQLFPSFLDIYSETRMSLLKVIVALCADLHDLCEMWKHFTAEHMEERAEMQSRIRDILHNLESGQSIDDRVLRTVATMMIENPTEEHAELMGDALQVISSKEDTETMAILQTVAGILVADDVIKNPTLVRKMFASVDGLPRPTTAKVFAPVKELWIKKFGASTFEQNATA